MKPSNTIISLFKLFFKKKKGGFSDLEVGFLPVVLELSSLPVFLVCDRTVVKNLAFYYKERIGVDVACVSKGLVDSPVGFVGFYDNLFKTSINFIGSSSKVQIYVVDKDLLNESLFEEPLLKGFFINSFIKYDELLSVLGKFNYVISNSLDVDGSYCVRGGVVDIRPVGGVACFRISFLQEVVFLYRLSNHFKIQGVVSEIVLNRIDFKKKHTIFKSLPKKHHYLNYVEGELFFNDNKNGSMVDFFSCVVDYQYYIKNRGSLVVVENPLLKDVGYLINNEFLFVPLWFSSGQKAPRSQARNIAEFVVGSFYVYSAFGICQFLGLEDGGDSNERACFKFSDGVIRLSPSLLGSVFFYSHDIGNSSLSSISKKTTWSRACSQARQKALSYVEDLVVYYKNRKKSFRAPYSLNQSLLDEFVSSFKFEDTEDQKESWLDVLGDMLSNVPMNRLLCGDVGFGKTEIAIRSSFVASFSSRKTIIISPTTVLSEQLYSCFYSRLSGFGVSVKKYFRGNQKKETLEAFVSGGVDVLIPTLLFYTK